MFEKIKKRDFELFVLDVFIAIHKIDLYTNDFSDASTLQSSSLHWDATIRELEIIGESLNNLLTNSTFEQSTPNYFRKIVNFRNVIVHGYFGIDGEEVWDVVKNKLHTLESDLLQRVHINGIDLTEVIKSERYEYSTQSNQQIVDYLDSLRTRL